MGAAFPPTTLYNHIALAIGGPVIVPKLYNGRNRTFFWATGEPQRLKLFFGATRSILPTADELAGKFNNSYDLLDSTLRQRDINAAIASPLRGNSLRYHQDLNARGFPIGEDLPTAQRPIIPNNDLSAQLARNPLAQKLLKQLFPFTPGQSTPFIRWLRPDGLPDIDGNNAIFARGASTIDNRYSFKIDQLLGTKYRFAFRYAVSPVTGTRSDWGGFNDPSDPIPQDAFNSRNTSLNYTHNISPSVVNEARISYSRGDALRAANETALSRDWGGELGLLPAIAGQGFPVILNRGFNSTGSFNGRSLDINLGMGDDLYWVRSRHTLKAGVEHRRIQLNRYDYGGLIVGELNSYGYRNVPSVAYYRWRYLAGYFQDDFKITSRLTLNLGVRWDLETPRTEKFDNQGSFDPFLQGTVNGKPVQGAFVFSGVNSPGPQPLADELQRLAAAPRAGLRRAPVDGVARIV